MNSTQSGRSGSFIHHYGQSDEIETGAGSENPTLFGAIGALNIFRSWPTGSARAKMEHVGSAKLIVLRVTN